MRDFLMRHREGLLLALLLGFSLLIISRQVRDPTGMTYFRRNVLAITSPFQNGFATVVGGVSGLWDNYVDLHGVRDENRKLREDVNHLRTEVQKLREELFRAGRLEEFAAYRLETGFEGTVARVIGESPDPWTRTIVVNRGKTDGIERGLTVVTPDGLVGRVVEVSGRSSVVRLIVDRSSRVPVVVSRSRARAILEGENSGTCQLKYLDRTQDVLEGDVIITSGLAGVYPRGVEVGSVTQVIRKSHGLYQYAKILPEAPLGRLEDVMILKSQSGRGDK
jgi:rod shape-determining protein MreC